MSMIQTKNQSALGTTFLDARYLMLDCTNDPLTAGLQINAPTAGEPVLILQTTDDDNTNPHLRLQDSLGARLIDLYVPDQTNFIGTMFLGDGGGSLVHVGGNDGVRNIGIGFNALAAVTTGYENVAVGEGTLENLTIGIRNVALGRQSLRALTIGGSNFGLGYRALNSAVASSGNLAVGVEALRDNIIGAANVAIGNAALLSATGSSNIGIGAFAGRRCTGNENVLIGVNAGYGVLGASTFHGTVAVGHNAGLALLSAGVDNTLIGHGAGLALTTGALNVFVGHDAGSLETTNANRLYIANSNTATPLVYGEFDTWRLGLGNQYAVDKYGQLTHASGQFAAAGDSQDSGFVCRLAQASHAVNTWYPLFPDGGTTPERLTIAAETGWTVIAHIIGITAGAAQQWGYEIIGLLERDGAGNTTLAGQTPRVIFESDANYEAQLAADDANEAIEVQVRRTGGVDYDVRWTASVKLVEVTYPA